MNTHKGRPMRDRVETWWCGMSAARHVEIVIFAFAVIVWTWAGISTWQDLIGKPRDAPFLRIPGQVRSVLFWWLPALVSGLTLRWRQLAPLAWSGLVVGPMVRLTSYLVSWFTSWDWVDTWISDDLIEGDPKAYGSAWLYIAFVVGIFGFAKLTRLLWRMESKIHRQRLRIAELEAEARNDT